MHTPLISVKELAAELGVSSDTVRRAVWSRAIPFFRIGKVLRFDVEAVHEAMRGHAHQGVRPETRARDGDSRQRARTRRPRAGNTGAQITRSLPSSPKPR